jgi:Mrp family chromosome partitioning ATPase
VLTASAPTAATASATIQLVAAASNFHSAAAGKPSLLTAPLSESIDVIPPAATQFLETTLTCDDDDAIAAVPAGSRPHATRHSEHRSAGRKRPLSAYIDRKRISPAALEPDDQRFRPGTTVASFRWPPICRSLAQQCRRDLDSVADLLLSRAEQGSAMIGVAGLFRGCGTTTTLLAMAARLAIRKKRVLMIDGNFSRPQLAALLDVVPTAGWQEVLAGAAPLADAVIRAADDGLDLLALGASPQGDATPFVAGQQIEACANSIRRQYDLALVDLGAFFDTSSRPVMLELIRNMRIGAVLAVALADESDERDLKTLAAQLDSSGCELLGRIENRVVKA